MDEKILITGATGFLGSKIYEYLNILKFEVVTLGRAPESDILCDLSKEQPTLKNSNLTVVVHSAGKAHTLPKSLTEIDEFYKVNLIGTENLLKGLRDNLPHTFIFMSTVAVYGKNSGEAIDETNELNGKTPYAKSKIMAENKVISFGKENKINIVILRLPLIAGQSPVGNLGAIVSAIKNGYYFRIGDGSKRRSMVAAIDIAKLIPSLFNKNGIYNLTDRRHPSYKEIDSCIAAHYGKSIKSMPFWIFTFLAKIGDVISFFPLNSLKLDKMSNSLTFSDDKAVAELNWNPDDVLNYIND